MKTRTEYELILFKDDKEMVKEWLDGNLYEWARVGRGYYRKINTLSALCTSDQLYIKKDITWQSIASEFLNDINSGNTNEWIHVKHEGMTSLQERFFAMCKEITELQDE